MKYSVNQQKSHGMCNYVYKHTQSGHNLFSTLQVHITNTKKLIQFSTPHVLVSFVAHKKSKWYSISHHMFSSIWGFT
jgi:hypothetical protein